jgi:two-component system, OmpR family, phosphate regulon response regulator OmpR
LSCQVIIKRVQVTCPLVRCVAMPWHAAMDPTTAPANTRARLLVVEDDEAMRSMLLAFLDREGMQAQGLPAADGLASALAQYQPHLIVMDVGLPGLSGLQVCQQLRARGNNVPVILLTARTEEVDRVLGLEMGADDYLGKPFSARELLARIHAVLRRTHKPSDPGVLDGGAMRIGSWEFHAAERRLKRQTGQGAVDTQLVSGLQCALLRIFVANPARTFSREELLLAAQGSGQALLLRSVDTAVMRLRRLLEPDPEEPRYIQTVRGQGYVFMPTGPLTTPPKPG